MQNYFKVHLAMLRVMGINIGAEKSSMLYRIYSVLFMISCVYYFIIAEFIDLLQFWGDMEHMTFNLCYLVTHFSGMCKATLLLIQSKTIWAYCEKLEQLSFLPNENRGGVKEREIIEVAVKQCNYQVYIFQFFVLTSVANRTIYAANDDSEVETFNLITNQTEMSLIREMPYTIWLPFNTQVSPWHEVAFVYEVITCGFYGLLIGTCDALITGFMVHIKAQLVILNRSLNFVKPKLKQTIKTKMINAVAEPIRIRDCVIHHQNILQLAENAENEFNKIVLIQFLCSLLLTCFQLVQISLYDVRSAKFLSMVIYVLLMVFQLLIYCWNGNEVRLESIAIADAAMYNTDWQNSYDLDLRGHLVLMICRAQRPIRVSAGGFAHLTLETFVTILRSASSYYMVLRRTNDSEENN